MVHLAVYQERKARDGAWDSQASTNDLTSRGHVSNGQVAMEYEEAHLKANSGTPSVP